MGAIHEQTSPADPQGQEPSVAASAPPTAFGKYQLFASLGRGGMADVFLSVARGPLGFNKLAVIKRLKQSLAEEPAFRTMFLDEARLAARLNHPNIVHTYEVGEHNGIYFIAMEYLEGQSLNKVIKEGLKRKEPLSHAVSARIIADALGGLSYAHELKDYDGAPLSIIHRDVSPHNIFVTHDGHVKVVDFGIAKAALSTQETEVGVLKGKVGYMSPEQAMGQPLDARADIFPMGIVLWEMLAGKRLMNGESAAQTLHKLVNEPVPRIGDVIQIDSDLAAIVDRSLQKDVTLRFQSAQEMREALEAYVKRIGGAREDEVARKMVSLFGGIREEVQRQIQKHMAVITAAANTQEAQSLNAGALHGGGRMSQRLMKLGVGNGSGSGVVSNYPPAGSTASLAPVPVPRWNTLALAAAAAGLFALTAVLLLFRFAPPPAQVAISTAPTGAPIDSRSAGPHAVDPHAADPELQVAPTPTFVAPAITPTVEPTAAPTPTLATEVIASPAKPVVNRPSVAPSRPTRSNSVAANASSLPTVAAPASNEENGTIQIGSSPGGARVLVDNRDVGRTPKWLPLPPGNHTVTLISPRDPSVKKSFAVTIESGQSISRSVSLD